MNGHSADLPIALVGCDFRIASSRWRSRLVLDGTEVGALYRQLIAGAGADGFFTLSTCNRNEWIVSGEQPQWAAELLRAHMVRRLHAEGAHRIVPYLLVGEAAVEHLFRVALGQESLVTGERQIARQLFKALETARASQTSSRTLNGLGTIAGRLVAQANRCGCLAATNKGVHSLAIAMLRQRLGQARPLRVAVIGLGYIGRRTRALLDANDEWIAVPCNRTVEDGPGRGIRPLTELATVLATVDAAVVCTHAPEPVVRAEHLAQRRGDRPVVIIDLGIPEQVSPDLPTTAQRIGLDELTATGAPTEPNARASRQAELLARRGVEQFRRLSREPDLLGVLSAVQRHSESLLAERLPRLVSDSYAHLAAEDRERLETDIRRMLSSYTHDLYGAIRETTGTTDCGCEATGDA